jgi:hypothetical protein
MTNGTIDKHNPSNNNWREDYEGHKCLHEKWWGEFRSDIKYMKDAIKENKTEISKIIVLLNQVNGGLGATRQNTESIKRVWQALIFLGLLIAGIYGITEWVLK